MVKNLINKFTYNFSRRIPKQQLKKMPKFKIHYLNLRGRAEAIRLLLNYVQQPYEDCRENFLEFTKNKDSKFKLN
jgi:hypothetical protein